MIILNINKSYYTILSKIIKNLIQYDLYIIKKIILKTKLIIHNFDIKLI